MTTDNVTLAEAYYTAMGDKNIANVEKYLHPNVQFTSPFYARITGKEEVLEAVKGFTNAFTSLVIRAKFGSDNQAMIVYDIDCPMLNRTMSSASLMTFQDNLIVKIELFFDPSPFKQS